MALVLIATPGAADANSFCDRAWADSYHEAHLYASSWTAAANDRKEVALVMATRVIVALAEWLTGVQATTTQALPWPRFGAIDKEGNPIDGDVIPPELMNATAELARQLIEKDRTADSKTETEGITRLKAGPVEFDFDRPHAKVLPDAVFYLIQHLCRLVARSGDRSVKLVRA
jgi:hypothetical protein